MVRKPTRCTAPILMPASGSPSRRVERHDIQYDTGTAVTRRVAGTSAAVDSAGGADRGAHPAIGSAGRSRPRQDRSGPHARDVATMFDELKAMADLHADRARLQAELDQARAELAR